MNIQSPSLDMIFKAQSVAVIGASPNPAKLGFMTLESIVKAGFEGRIFPVNPKGGEILGLKAYTSLLEIPESVDLAVIIVPARFVADVLRMAVKKGVPGAVILTAGFKEAGRIDLEDEITTIAKSGGLRFVGPNVQGINYLPNKLCAMFFPVITMPGPLAVITQSGSATAALSEWAVDDGLGICAAVNLGNQADICEADYLNYFGQDESVGAIAMYIEGLENGRRFLDTVNKVSAVKPIMVLKSGKTEIAKEAAASHTGTLAGSHRVFNAALQQVGGLIADNLTDLYDRAKGTALIKSPKGGRILSIATSGGMGALAADAAASENLTFPALPKQYIETMKNENVSPLAHLANPLDLGYVNIAAFEKAASIADDYDIADIILLNFGDPMPDAVDVIIDLAARLKSLVVVSYCGGGPEERNDRTRLNRNGIPVFHSPERAIRGIGAAVGYAQCNKKVNNRKAYYLGENTHRNGKYCLIPEPEAVSRLSDYNISYPQHGLATSAQSAVSIANDIGYPVVLKIVSPDIYHKTDVGGVITGLENSDAVSKAYLKMKKKIKAKLPYADIKGVLVCKQAETGREVIAGAIRDPVFGPTVMFGLGGVFAEILQDTSFRIAPINTSQAIEMIKEIKGYGVLSGARSETCIDNNSLAELLVKISNLLIEQPNIRELDLNPVRLSDKGIMALDIRLIVGQS